MTSVGVTRTNSGAISKTWTARILRLLPRVSQLGVDRRCGDLSITELSTRLFGGNCKEVGRGMHGVVFVGESEFGALALKVIKRTGPFTRGARPRAPSSAKTLPDPEGNIASGVDWVSYGCCKTDTTELDAMRVLMTKVVETDVCNNVVQFVAALDVNDTEGCRCRAYVLRAADGDLDGWLKNAPRSVRAVRACIRQVLYAICTTNCTGVLNNDLYCKNILYEETQVGFRVYHGRIGQRALEFETEGFFFLLADYGLATTTEREHDSLGNDCFPKNRLTPRSLAAVPINKHVLQLDDLSPYARDALAFLMSLGDALPSSHGGFSVVRTLLDELNRVNAKGRMGKNDLATYTLWAMDTLDAVDVPQRADAETLHSVASGCGD
jgi:hypothetical protein